MFSFCVKNPKDIWTAYTQFTVRSVHTAAAMLGQQEAAVAAAATIALRVGSDTSAAAVASSNNQVNLEHFST